jgi:hypothetical protein
VNLTEELDELIREAELALVVLRDDGRLENAEGLDGALAPFRRKPARARTAVEQMRRRPTARQVLASHEHHVAEARAAYERARGEQ